jgi:hypothetical protein
MESILWLFGLARDALFPRQARQVPDPVYGTEAWFNKHAKPKCEVCKGLGMNRYWHYQDESELVACFECFPENVRAREVHEAWERDRARERFEEEWRIKKALARARFSRII